MQEISKVSNICQSNCAEVQTVNSASFTRALSPMLANNPSISLDASGNLHFRLSSCSSSSYLQSTSMLRCAHLCIFLLFASVFALCPASNELGPQETAKLHETALLMLCLAACHGVASKHGQKCRNMSQHVSGFLQLLEGQFLHHAKLTELLTVLARPGHTSSIID